MHFLWKEKNAEAVAGKKWKRLLKLTKEKIS